MWPLPYFFLNAKKKKKIEIANSKVDFSFPKHPLYLFTHLFLKFLSFGFYDIPHPSFFSFLCVGFLSLDVLSASLIPASPSVSRNYLQTMFQVMS